jgi:hypothetical protein
VCHESDLTNVTDDGLFQSRKELGPIFHHGLESRGSRYVQRHCECKIIDYLEDKLPKNCDQS